MLAAVLPAHVTLAAIETVVRAAHKRRRFARRCIAVGLALCRRRAIGQRHRHDARTACLALQITQRMVGVAVRTANRTGRMIRVSTVLGALEHGRFQFRAGANVGECDAATMWNRIHTTNANCQYSIHSITPRERNKNKTNRQVAWARSHSVVYVFESVPHK